MKAALAGVDAEVPIEASADVADAAAAGRQVSQVAQAAAKDVNVGVNVDRGLVARAFRAAFRSNPQLLQTMRTGIPAVLSSPVGLAAATLAVSFAAGFVAALGAALVAAGLPAVFIGLGAFLLKDNKQIVKGFEGMVDRIKAAFEGVADPLIGPFLESMDLVGAAAERVAPMVETLMEAFAPAVIPIVEGLLGLVENFMGALASNPDALQGMTDALSAFGEHLPRLGTALAGFFSTIATNENTVKNIGPLVSILSGAIGALGHIISFYATMFDFWVRAWHRAEDTIGMVVQFVKNAIPVLTGAFEAAVGFFQKLPGRIGQFLSRLPGKVAQHFKRSALQMLYWAGFGVTKVLLFLGGLPGRAREALKSLWGRIRGAFETVAREGPAKARELVDRFIQFMQQLPGRAFREAIRVRAAILDAFRGARSWLFEAGKDILIGLANGVKGAIGAAVDAAKEAALAVLGGVKSALGIGSPSTVMRDEVGHWIPVGIAEGIRLNEDAARDALNALTAHLAEPRVRVGAGNARPATAAATGEQGISVNLTALSDQFSLQQVMDDLAFRGAA